MKITDKRNTASVKFSSINSGGIFQSRGRFYCKVADASNKAIDLETGGPLILNYDSEVTLCQNAELIIHD